jgi:WD40 repeat protein
VLTYTVGAVWILRFNYDGTLLASAGNDTAIRLWKVNESSMQCDVCVLFFRCLSVVLLVTGSDASYFHKEPVAVFEGHQADVLSVSWSNVCCIWN